MVVCATTENIQTTRGSRQPRKIKNAAIAVRIERTGNPLETADHTGAGCIETGEIEFDAIRSGSTRQVAAEHAGINKQTVVARPAIDNVSLAPADDLVIAIATQQCVRATLSVQKVCIRATAQIVITIAAIQRIALAATDQPIVAEFAPQRDHVPPQSDRRQIDHVVAAGSEGLAENLLDTFDGERTEGAVTERQTIGANTTAYHAIDDRLADHRRIDDDLIITGAAIDLIVETVLARDAVIAGAPVEDIGAGTAV
ncbi:hypothetical protein FHS96_002424 [Sphingomonas zeicaulis]